MPITALARTEHIADIPFSVNTVANLPTQGGQLPSDRWMYGLLLEWEGRLTMPASGGPTAELADAPYSLIERVTVDGYYRPAARPDKLIDLRGADLREFAAQNLGFNPLVSGTLGHAASTAYDLRFIIPVPFVPLMVPPTLQIGYLLDAPNYDALKLTIQFGDQNSVQSGATTQPTFSAYGSASGDPRLRVHGQFALAGSGQFAGFMPGKIYRDFQEVTGSLMTTSATEVRLFDIPKGDMVRSIMVKTGVRATGVSPGNNAYASLSDSILSRIKVFRGINKVNRYFVDFAISKEDTALTYRRRHSAGYTLIDWSQRGLSELLDLRALTGASGDTDVYIGADVTGAANQGAVFVTERWRGQPVNLVPRRK
jgi:hypothetical protein